MKDSPDLSLVIACYNEEPILRASVEQIFDVLDHATFTYEIIFVDDASHDLTRDLIDEIIAQNSGKRLSRLFHKKNEGRGGTVTDGIRAACGTIVGFIDVDLEVHARYIPSCVLAILKGADVATGLRVYRFQLRSLDRFVLSKGYQWLVRHTLQLKGVSDTETGFKFFKRERVLPLLDECQDRHWFWDTEIMARASWSGYCIVEIPVLFLRRFDKKSSVHSVRDTLEYFQKLWAFRRKLSSKRELP